MKAELQLQEAKETMKALGKDVGDEVAGMAEAERQKLIQETRDAATKKQKAEEQRLAEQAERVDYVTRALRLEELPVLEARYARRLVEDREAHDAAYEKKVASGEAAHAAALLEKARLAPVQPHRAAFEADVSAARRAAHAEAREAARLKFEADKIARKVARARRRHEEHEEEQERLRQEEDDRAFEAAAAARRAEEEAEEERVRAEQEAERRALEEERRAQREAEEEQRRAENAKLSAERAALRKEQEAERAAEREKQDKLAKERAEREKALRDRRDTVRKREEMNEEAARMRKRRDAEEKRRAEAAKRRAEAAKAADASAEEKKKKEQQGRIGAYERAFLRIKDATGVSDLDQVISKFMTQEDTNRNLRQLRKDGQARIEALKEEIERSKQTLESLQFGGPVGPASRRAVDDLELKLSAGGVVHDRARARFEANNKTLVGVAAGAEHLVDKLEGLPFGAATPPVTENTVVQVLAMCEAKMLRALEAARAKGAARKPGAATPTPRAPNTPSARSPGAAVTKHNFRLELFPEPGDDSGDEEGDDSGEEAGEESVLDRELVKANAEAVKERACGRKKGVFSAAKATPATPGSVKGKAGRGQRAGLA